MTYSFDTFCEDCRTALKAADNADSHERVRRNLEKLAVDPDFVAAYCGDDAEPDIRTIYRDEETGFNVLVHIYEAGKQGPPHDHGTSWAVYAQVKEHTDMTFWRRTDQDGGEGAATLEQMHVLHLEPGMAGKLEPGDIHSIAFPDGARFVRVTGTDLDKIETLQFDPDAGTAKVGDRLRR